MSRYNTSLRKAFISLTSLLTLMLIAAVMHAQPQVEGDVGRSAIDALARSYKDSVVLRWIPSNSRIWRMANHAGYIVERAPFNGGRPANDAYQRLTPSPLRPWTLDEWKQSRITVEDKYAGVAIQLLSDEEAGRNMDTVPRYSLALTAANYDAIAASGLALRFVDRNVRRGDRYVYRIMVAITGTESIVDTAFVDVEVKDLEEEGKPQPFANAGDGSIQILWGDNGYMGYHIYRSEDNGRTYKRLSQVPMVLMQSDTGEPQPLQYLDSDIVNYRKYRYQIRGISPFAELSKPGEVEAMGRDLTPPPAPELAEPMQAGKTRVKLEWKMPETSKDFVGFIVARSQFADTGFQKLTPRLLPPNARSFIDEKATELEPYYQVAAMDSAGNGGPSLVMMATIIDSVPPAPPKGIVATIDTNGIVRLHWPASREKKVIGYRVLRANDIHDEFTQVTPEVLADTVFTDTVTVQTLTRYVYYQVASVDNRKNHSDPSEIVSLRRPDVIPPEPSAFTDVVVSDSTVVLRWAASRSTDLRAQILLRRLSGESQWTEIVRLGRNVETYADRKVTQTTAYEYTIITEDSSGLRSEPAMSVEGRPYDTGIRPGVTDLRVQFDSTSRSVQLSWHYTPTRKEKYWFGIYRGEKGHPMALYKSIEATQTRFTDSDLSGVGTYIYAVRVMFDVADSRVSAPVVVVVQ